MPVQDIYKFTNSDDKRRIVAGTVLSGKIKVGDQILFYPSGKKSRVKSIEAFNRPKQIEATAGQAIGITLRSQLYITRGEVAIINKKPLPSISSRIKVSLFWLSKEPMVEGRDYIFKLGTFRVMAQIETIHKIMDTSDLTEIASKDKIEKNYIAECTLQLSKAIATDSIDGHLETSRFVLVDNYHISGGGIILESLEDKDTIAREKILVRNFNWVKSMIPYFRRARKYGHSSALIFVTGNKGVGRKKLAKRLERRLFSKGRIAYFFGLANLLYGVDSDIRGLSSSKEEHFRRLSEVCHLMLNAGMILIVTVVDLAQDDIRFIKLAVQPSKMGIIWVGENVTTDIKYDIKIDDISNMQQALVDLEELLESMDVIKPQDINSSS